MSTRIATACNNTDLTGEYEDSHFVFTRGDSRIAITLPKNEYTEKLNRSNRFLIDDSESNHVLAYSLTKPLKVGTTYNGEGIYKFVLQEVPATDDDNLDLMVADYYKHFENERGETTDIGMISGGGKGGWL